MSNKKKPVKRAKNANKAAAAKEPTRGQKAAATRAANQVSKVAAEEVKAQTAPNPAAVEVKQLEDRDALAKELLGENAVVWTATHDFKGNAFPAPLFRVGVTTDKPNSYLVEDGKLMVGTGRTFAEAFRSAKKSAVVIARIADEV